MSLSRINIWMFSFALLLLSCTEKDEIQKYPVFGFDMLENVRLFESGSDALFRWVEKDIKGAVLLHVSDADSLGIIPPPDMEKLKDMVASGKKEQLRYRKERIYKDDDYLYAASGLGIIHKIYWILPYRYLDDVSIAEGEIKQFLKDRGTFRESDIDSMRMEFGCLTGRLSDTDITICSPRTMHIINEPVILSLDAGFVPLYADGLSVSKLLAAKKLFDELAFKKIRVIRVDISYNIENGRTKPTHRYLGNDFFEGIKDPQIFRAGSPPELWKHRDMAENMLSGGEDLRVVEYLSGPLKTYPDDMPLKALNAMAHLKAGNIGESFNGLDEICRKDVHYCYGFLEAGSVLEDRKEYEKAEKFFRKALDVLPGRSYVKERYASFLEKRGQKNRAGHAGKESGSDR